MKIKMNVPNILTMIRIACTPIIILLFLVPIPYGIGKFVALGVYIFGCFTDLLDGKIARKYNLITDFGKFMDQIADKFITTTAMILVLFAGVTYTWLAVLMLLVVVLRDILISGIRMVAANKNFVIPADMYGKVKSFFLDISSMILMLSVGLYEVTESKFVDYIRLFGIAVMIVGVILSVLSCVNYSLKAIKALDGINQETTSSETESADEIKIANDDEVDENLIVETAEKTQNKSKSSKKDAKNEKKTKK